MPTPWNLPSIPVSYGTAKGVSFSVIEAPFGDGYTQRAADGLNATKQTWNVEWETLEEADKQTIEDFLVARAGVESFNWTPPGEAASHMFRCTEFRVAPDGYLTYSITAIFVEEFDL